MKSQRASFWLLFILLLSFAGACSRTSLPDPTGVPVLLIPLDGPIANRRSEISGMAWYDSHLILLPQFPERFSKNDGGAIFALSKTEILDHLENNTLSPLTPQEIPFITHGIGDNIPGFEGFEAIAFQGNRVFLTIEAGLLNTRAYLVTGTITPDLSSISLDPTKLVEIPAQASIPNFSDESIVIYGSRALTLYEANGSGVNPSPIAHTFDLSLQPQKPFPFPHIEYRITDATEMDSQGRFWVINLFYFGDILIKSDYDPLRPEWRHNSPLSQWLPVVRLVELQMGEDGIRLSDRKPIYLEHEHKYYPPNWEAIVRLDERGFLLASDKYPKTLLGFIAFP